MLLTFSRLDLVTSPAVTGQNKWKKIDGFSHFLWPIFIWLTMNARVMNSLTYHLVFHPTPPPSLSTNHQHTVRHEHECLLHSITCLLLYFRPHGSLCTSYIECLAQTNRSAHKHTHGHTHTQVGVIHRSGRAGAPAEVTTRSFIFKPTTE